MQLYASSVHLDSVSAAFHAACAEGFLHTTAVSDTFCAGSGGAVNKEPNHTDAKNQVVCVTKAAFVVQTLLFGKWSVSSTLPAVEAQVSHSQKRSCKD